MHLVSTFCVQMLVAVESRGVFYVFRNTYFVHACGSKNTPEIILGALRENVIVGQWFGLGLAYCPAPLLH